MAVNILVPTMGESISEATVSAWLKAEGDAVTEGDVLVELETDKVMVEVPAPCSGKLGGIAQAEGETVSVDDVLGNIEEGAAGATPQASKTVPSSPAAAAASAAPIVAAPAGVGPAVQRLAAETGINPANVTGTGPGGRVTKGDMLQATAPPQPSAPAPAQAAPIMPPAPRRAAGECTEERVPLSRLRQRIAERLVEAQQTAAILTTFNEIDMSEVISLRSQYKDMFRERYGVGLGFMSFFAKACVHALKEVPAVNAELDGIDLVYKKYYDIGVAVGSARGLVVPVVRDSDLLSYIEIEMEIARLAQKARNNSLSLDDLSGGTFTITNGGVYGSMMSTPILNPPQVGILGMHNIVKRAVVVRDEVKIRPMMYVALSYDHRVIDGKQAVEFLVKVKQRIEEPARLLLEI